ncbi:hypothetical protein QR46_2174 [Giardia duodenalis assemblage B]|uniref:Uncharacterized protein n=2 Tax=Giardia intestinalis TaxID=5741 RepID=A0A132NUU9_GIAIN|nr:Hypothetical protein GL50581_3661 [Giardia intestinalis ATCC 50581]KWX13834.1 hypothetical protein QR46_2174 [Giardia intestinalis assemblage B]
MQTDNVQVLGGEQMQDIEADDIRMKVAPVNEARQAQLPSIQMAPEQLQTSIGKVSIAYLSKFVVPYVDAYEKMQPWTSKDITLM